MFCFLIPLHFTLFHLTPLIPPQSTSSHLTSPQSTSSHLTSSQSTSSHLTSSQSTSSHLTSSQSTSSHLTSSQSTSSHLTPSQSTSSHLTSSQSTSSHLTSSQSTSSHSTSSQSTSVPHHFIFFSPTINSHRFLFLHITPFSILNVQYSNSFPVSPSYLFHHHLPPLPHLSFFITRVCKELKDSQETLDQSESW